MIGRHGRWIYFLEVTIAALIALAIYLSMSLKTWEELMQMALESYKQGDFTEAAKSFELAVKKAEKDNPKGPQTSISQLGLADVYLSQKQFSKAEPLYLEVLTAQKKHFGPESNYVLQTLIKLGDISEKLDQRDRALGYFNQALKLAKKLYGPESPEVKNIEDRAKLPSF